MTNDKPTTTRQPETAQKASGFRELVGYRLIAWREGYAELELPIGVKHGNRTGRVHGGVYATILDAAMGHAATWCPVEGNVRRCVTLSLTTHFLEGAWSGTMRAIARLESADGRLATCAGEVVSEDGTPLAHGQASFRYFAGSERLTGVPR